VLVLALPAAQAGTVTFTVSDDLSSIPGSSDPLGLGGSPFSLTGTIDQGADGQTSFTPMTLMVTATSSLVQQTLTLDACGTSGAPSGCSGAPAPNLTITMDSATLTFDVSVAGILAPLTAVVNLPGEFQNNGSVSLANFTDVPIGSGSVLSYDASILGTGAVGISGTASMSGVVTTGPPPPPTVPEPTTIALLAGGLIGLVLKRRLSA